jgi:peroxiredoxin
MNLLSKIFKQRYSWLGLIVFALGISNVALIWQNLQMRSQLQQNEPQKLEIGDRIQNFSAKGLKGESIEINFSENSKKRFLFFFTSTCPYCKEQFPDWKELILRAKDKNIEIFGIVSESEKNAEIEKYLDSFGCGTKSETPLQILFVSNKILQDNKLTLTPTTILLSGDGQVERNWTGKWKESDKTLAMAQLKN